MLEIADLTLEYPDWSASYDLVVPREKMCALVGPSGGGKTTLLHAVAGFAAPVRGTLRFDGQDLTRLKPAARPLSIMFQDHNLFPHLTAAQNVGLGLDPGLRLSAAQQGSVTRALERVRLPDVEKRLPAELSGGQRQRVALARALVRERPLMLLDEAFSALDPGLRREMIALVDEIGRERGLTVVISIHTPEDARDVADLAALVAEGRVTAAGPFSELFAPASHPELERFFRGGAT